MASESLSEQLSGRLIEDFRENINLEAIMSEFPKLVRG
ncbi:hypothetical protein [Enterococcus phage vB_Efs6_KEN03]